MITILGQLNIVEILFLCILIYGFMFLMSIGPAFYIVVQLMKKSNYHGDSSTEFRHLKGSKIKMFYTYETFLYDEYDKEAKRLGAK